jgi:hypothetical protein
MGAVDRLGMAGAMAWALQSGTGKLYKFGLNKDDHQHYWPQDAQGSVMTHFPPILATPTEKAPTTSTTIGATCVAAGAYGTCAVGENGVFRCWGKDRYGEDTVSAELQVSGIVSRAEKGEEATCVQLATNGKARCWPSKWYGSRLPQENELVEFGPVRTLTVGAYGACFVGLNGTLRCWDFRGTQALSYESVPGDLHDIHTISAGHVGPVCAVSGTPGEPGLLHCWSISSGTVPSNVGLVKAVDVKQGHACVIRADDTVQCFCLSTYGCHGGSTDVPSDLGKALAVAAGGSHTCAILAADSTVRCWGSIAAPPETLGAVATLVAGYAHACAVRSSDQHMVCWGGNSHGQADVPSDLGAVQCPGVQATTEASSLMQNNPAMVYGKESGKKHENNKAPSESGDAA